MHYQQELKRISQKLLAAKRNAQETFLRSLLKMRVNPGLSFTGMLKDVRGIARIYL